MKIEFWDSEGGVGFTAFLLEEGEEIHFAICNLAPYIVIPLIQKILISRGKKYNIKKVKEMCLK